MNPLATVLIAVLGFGTAWSAAPEPEPEPEESSHSNASQTPFPEEITVTATRTERAVFETPAAITTLDREQILEAQAYGYQDLFKDVPGTLTVGGPRRTAEEPMIRGFQDEQVVIRVNGARQNFNQSHRGRFFLDPSLLKGIEVLRGTSSSAYGSGAMGGVISLVTMDPDDFLGGGDGAGASLRSSYQSNGSALGIYGSVMPSMMSSMCWAPMLPTSWMAMWKTEIIPQSPPPGTRSETAL